MIAYPRSLLTTFCRPGVARVRIIVPNEPQFSIIAYRSGSGCRILSISSMPSFYHKLLRLSTKAHMPLSLAPTQKLRKLKNGQHFEERRWVCEQGRMVGDQRY